MTLVIGGTGTVGSQVVKRSVNEGRAVRVLTRDPEGEAAQSIARPNVTLVRGDISDEASLKQAMVDVESVVIVVPPSVDTAALKRPIIDAAKDVGVEHIVSLSALGADSLSPVRLASEHGKADAHLRASGVAYTIVQPHYFMENLLWDAESVRVRGELPHGLGDGRVGIVAVNDVADVIVRALADRSHRGQVYELTGPESISMADVAARLSKRLSRTVSSIQVQPGDLKTAFVTIGLPVSLADAFVELFAAFSAGHGDKVTPVVEQVLDRPAMSIDAWIEANIRLFESSTLQH